MITGPEDHSSDIEGKEGREAVLAKAKMVAHEVSDCGVHPKVVVGSFVKIMGEAGQLTDDDRASVIALVQGKLSREAALEFIDGFK